FLKRYPILQGITFPIASLCSIYSQFSVISESIRSYLFYAVGKISTFQVLAIFKCTVSDLFQSFREYHLFQVLCAFKSILRNCSHSFRDLHPLQAASLERAFIGIPCYRRPVKGQLHTLQAAAPVKYILAHLL